MLKKTGIRQDIEVEKAHVEAIQCSDVLNVHSNFISCVCISDGPEPYIASASWDCTILIHDYRTKELRATLRSPSGAIISDIGTCTRKSVADMVGSFSMDGKIRIYDALQNFEIIHCFDHSPRLECSVLGAVKIVYFDRPYCVSGGVDRVVRVRDLNCPKDAIKVLRGHGGGIKCLDISEKGIVASGSNDNNVKLWDLFTGKFLRTLRGHSLEVNAVNFIRNSSWLLTGSEDNLFRVWDATSGERLRIFKGHSGATITSIGSVYIPGILPPLAIVGGTERESYTSQLINPLEVWRLDTSELIATCSGHRDEVAAVTVFCEATAEQVVCEAISGGVDKSIRLWDITQFLNVYLPTITHEEMSLGGDSEMSGSVSVMEEGDVGDLDQSVYSEL